MALYNVRDALKLLQTYKITSHEESVRRWLRQGYIKGIPPESRKEGWLIQEENLLDFIRARMPENITLDPSNTTNNAKEDTRDAIRAEMWWELVRKNLFEDALEVKKSSVRACVEHMGFSKAFETYAWGYLQQNKRGYATPRIPYLLEAALFDGHRIKLDTAYEAKEEQILFAVLEHLRQEKVT
ncbi:hypothetical protein GCM10028778_21060 [Barrientosiimonas marina]|uniref:DNA-binding protein n=1 Tax=Lentibacillus kimchii TaxID=1542911 RepID=A0ABW2UTP6_9BACI